MFKRATLRQHATEQGVEVPRKKRQARSGVHLGSDKQTDAEFYAVLQIEAEGENQDYFVTVDRCLVMVTALDKEVAILPSSPHPITVKSGGRTYQISDGEIVCIGAEGRAARVIEQEDGSFRLNPIAES